MDDTGKTAEKTSLTHATSNSPRSYNFLLRMSKRMGKVATRSFVEVKQFLNQDVIVSPTDRFLSGMPRVRMQKHEAAPTVQQEVDREMQKDRQKAAREGELRVDAAKKDLSQIIKQSKEVLAEANTAFPITLFPDTVYVDRTKVTIIKRDFFWSSDTMSFRIEDVLNVSATLGPIFGSLTIASRVMSSVDHFQIKHFWRKDAINLKHIIQGYVIAQHNKIDVAHLSKDELVRTLREIGHDKNS